MKYDPITGRTTEYTQADAKKDVESLHTMIDSDERDIMDDERDRLMAFIETAPDWRARAMAEPPFTFQQQEYIRRVVQEGVDTTLRDMTAELTTRGIRSSDL